MTQSFREKMILRLIVKGLQKILAWLHYHANGNTTRKSLAFRKTQREKVIKPTELTQNVSRLKGIAISSA